MPNTAIQLRTRSGVIPTLGDGKRGTQQHGYMHNEPDAQKAALADFTLDQLAILRPCKTHPGQIRRRKSPHSPRVRMAWNIFGCPNLELGGTILQQRKPSRSTPVTSVP
jgi:hypothetical protein